MHLDKRQANMLAHLISELRRPSASHKAKVRPSRLDSCSPLWDLLWWTVCLFVGVDVLEVILSPTQQAYSTPWL